MPSLNLLLAQSQILGNSLYEMHIDCGDKVYLGAEKIRRPKYLLGIQDLSTLKYGYYSMNF